MSEFLTLLNVWESLNLESIGFVWRWGFLQGGSHSVSHVLGLQEWTIRTSSCLHFVCAWGQPWLPSSDTIYPVLRQCLAGLKFVNETEQQVSPKDPPIIQEKISELQSDAIKHEFFLLSRMGTETVLALCGPAPACLQLCIRAFLFSFLVSSSCLTLKSSQLRSTRL